MPLPALRRPKRKVIPLCHRTAPQSCTFEPMARIKGVSTKHIARTTPRPRLKRAKETSTSMVKVPALKKIRRNRPGAVALREIQR
jgi:hypothetical protein